MEILKEVNIIIIHHSQNNDSVEEIKSKHLKRGFEDIGYHYLIGNGINTEDGKLYIGRNKKFAGAHVLHYNHNSIGICLIGNLDKNPPTEKQIKTLKILIKKIMKKYNIDKKNIFGHNEFPEVKKTCPGKLIDMEKLRNELKHNNY